MSMNYGDGSLGDGDAETQPMYDDRNHDFTLNATQPFDSQNFTASFHGGKGRDNNEVQLLQGNVLFDDTVPVEDAFEMQDLGGETQVLDYPDYFETQLIDEFNSEGEGTDKTKLLDDSDELSDSDSHRRGKSESLDVQMNRHTSLEHSKNKAMECQEICFSGLNVSTETPTSEVSKQPNPGPVQRFTSIRAASLRASGLAAWKKALEKTNKGSCSLLTDNQHLEKQAVKSDGSNTEVVKEADQVSITGRDNNEVRGLLNGHTANSGCSTLKKLSSGDHFVENEKVSSFGDNDEGEKEMLQLSTSENGLAGLSYIDSQEPGESSQAHALACVQRLIEENRLLFDNDSDLEKSSKGKSNFISTTKGPQSLAKKTKGRGTYVKSTIFDWDDEREDEGGGEIFCRRKEEFFGERSFAKLSKAKGNQFVRYRDCKGKSNSKNEIFNHCDSNMVVNGSKLNKKRVSEIEMNATNNIVNEFGEESNIATSAGQLKAAKVLNVGFDTQMAAEAMEALFCGDGISNTDANDMLGKSEGSKKEYSGTKATKSSQRKRRSLNEDCNIGFAAKPSKQPPKSSENAGNGCDLDGVMTRRRRAKADAEVLTSHRVKVGDTTPAGDGHQRTAKTRSWSVRKRSLPEELATATPIAHRTRQASVFSRLESAENVLRGGEEINCLMDVDASEKEKSGADAEAVKVLDAKGKSSDPLSTESAALENFKPKSMSNGFSCPRRRRSCRQLSGQLKLDAQHKPSNQLENIGKSVSVHKRSWSNAKTSSVTNLNKKINTRSSVVACLDFSSMYSTSRVELSLQTGDKTASSNENRKKSYQDLMDAKDVKLNDRNSSACFSPSAQDEVKASSVNLLKEATEPSKSACTSPVDFMSPVNDTSPVCVGDGYLKQSCKRSLSRSFMTREIGRLCATWHEPLSSPKDSRKRRDLANVRILFSQHLDDDIVKQQKKIADRLKVSIASSIIEATHFITDRFVRTRNMLEAIASGKPVVTHLWLENVGRANYYIDEQKYILRDMKKEKELGFNMPVSLALACQHPLLQGQRVLITPNTKPSKEIVSGLVKTVGGQAVERVGRFALKDETTPDDLLILSSEEDYEVCVPFLKKGAAVYSSELLLNGIVTQKLEYERHQLFADNVKRTRSTIWLKRGGESFVPVIKKK